MIALARILKESWTLVEGRADEFASYFYARLFLSEPSLRDLFPVEMSAQRSRFLAAVVTAVQTVDDSERHAEYLQALGRDHRKFQVAPEHYALVGTALLDALRRCGGEAWSIEHDQAWRAAYDTIAARMLTGAARDSHRPPYWDAVVLRHERRGRDVAVFTCQPLMPYDFRAGQYASIECSYQPRLWRTYSMANAPRPEDTLEFHVRAVAAGLVSSALVHRLKAGDMIRLGPPMGNMAIDNTSHRNVVCIAGGTGLAPIKSIIEEFSHYNRQRWVHLFVGATDRDDLYDLPALSRLAARYPWLSATPACSGDLTYNGEQGNIGDVVERCGPWADHDFYVCGSPAMVKGTLATLIGLGVRPSRVWYDPWGGIPT